MSPIPNQIAVLAFKRPIVYAFNASRHSSVAAALAWCAGPGAGWFRDRRYSLMVHDRRRPAVRGWKDKHR